MAAPWLPPDLAALGGVNPWHLAGYYGMIKRLDEAFGRQMDALKSLDMLENTIFLFTSDHGCHFKTRNGEYKRSCRESSIRLPTVITGPGFTEGGQARSLFSTVDVAPTLIDAAGLDVPREMSGRPLGTRTGRPAAEQRASVFIQISESETGRALRTDRWKYAVTDPYNQAEPAAEVYCESHLYDLRSDPYELVNLFGMAPFRSVASDLCRQLLEHIALAEDRRPQIELAEDRPARQFRPKATDLVGTVNWDMH